MELEIDEEYWHHAFREVLVHEVVIRGPIGLFPQLLGISGLSMDHGQAADVAGEHVLAVSATDEAIAAIRALGLTVDVQASQDDQRTLLARVLQEGGPGVNDIDVS